ncbi:MAG: DUF2255 family protein, partial [Trebonia sp.]
HYLYLDDVDHGAQPGRLSGQGAWSWAGGPAGTRGQQELPRARGSALTGTSTTYAKARPQAHSPGKSPGGGTSVTGWIPPELDWIGRTGEPEISSRRTYGTLRPFVTIWVCAAVDGVLVRSAHGPSNGWYRRAQCNPPAHPSGLKGTGMEYTRLGASGPKVSRIALDCMSFDDTSRGFTGEQGRLRVWLAVRTPVYSNARRWRETRPRWR